MKISSQKLAKALIASLAEGKQPARLATDFKEYLHKNHLTGLIPHVVNHLGREVRLLDARTKAHIVVSHDMPQATHQLIERLIGKKESDASAVTIDPSLIGGFRAMYRGKLFDGSVRHYLQTLRAALLN